MSKLVVKTVHKGKPLRDQSFMWTSPRETPVSVPIGLDEFKVFKANRPVSATVTFNTDTVGLVLNLHSHGVDKVGNYIHINDIYTGYGPAVSYVYLNIPLELLGLTKGVPYKLKCILESAQSIKADKTYSEDERLFSLHLDKCIKDGVEKALKDRIDLMRFVEKIIEIDYGAIGIHWCNNSDLVVNVDLISPRYSKCSECDVGHDLINMKHVIDDENIKHLCVECATNN